MGDPWTTHSALVVDDISSMVLLCGHCRRGGSIDSIVTRPYAAGFLVDIVDARQISDGCAVRR